MLKPLLLALGIGLSLAAQAQSDYPSKPIRFVVMSAPGSGGDTLSRLLADKMAPLLKATFVIDNKPGAGGVIATDLGAKAPPDGYTITLGSYTAHVLLPALNPKLPYSPGKDFAYIGQIGTASILLLATNDFPASNIKELVALAKKSPGLQYASWGNGSTGHFCGELLNQRQKAGMSHIPYKSITQIQQDLLGGHIKLAWVDMVSGMTTLKTGKVKAVASCMSAVPGLPNVSTFDAEGIDFAGKRMSTPRWTLFAPTGTPAPIVEKLAGALKTTLEMPDVKAKLLEWGTSAEFLPGDTMRAKTEGDIQAWKAVADAANITE